MKERFQLFAFLGLNLEQCTQDLYAIPCGVLDEIAAISGVEMDESTTPQELLHFAFEREQTIVIPSFSREYATSQLCQIVNPHVEWRTSPLFQAVEQHLDLQNASIHTLQQKWEKWRVEEHGLPSQDNPKRIPQRILFKWCRWIGVQTHSKTSALDMCHFVDLWARNTPDALRLQLASSVLQGCSIPIAKVLDLLASLSSSEGGTTKLIPLPIERNGAMQYISKVFGFDLSSARYPVLEAIYMQELWKSSNFPPPDTVALRLRYQMIRRVYKHPRDVNLPQDPSAFDLTQRFNPNLPPEWYEDQYLMDMALDEGFTTEELMDESGFTLMQQASFEAGFFFANSLPREYLPTHTVIYMEDRQSIDLSNCVVFGLAPTVIRVRDGSYSLYTFDELEALFRTQGHLANPQDPDHNSFPPRSIRKLHRMAQEMGKTALCRVLDVFQRGAKQHPSFASLHQFSLCEKRKSQLHKAITLLLELGMYMRAWNGTDPISIRDITVPTDQDQIDLRVANALAKLQEHVSTFGNLAEEAFWNLPIYRYSGREYRPSSDEEDGITLGQRIFIVVNRSDLIASCIRLSSNWLISSACRYAEEFECYLPVNIQDLEFSA